MNTITTNWISPERCLDAMHRFWNEQVEARATERGVVMSLPLMYPDGLQVQVFVEQVAPAAAILSDRGVSIAHLIYRFDPTTREVGPAEQQLRQIFEQRQLSPAWGGTVDGTVEKEIRVDCILQSRRALAWKIVKRRGPMLVYMEQWGWRWTDIKSQNPTLLRGMIYDPDRQEWDDTTTGIANQVCDFFCPYFDTATINRAIDTSLSGAN